MRDFITTLGSEFQRLSLINAISLGALIGAFVFSGTLIF